MKNKISILKLLIVLPALLVATGCASITRGTTDALVVNSEPAQADVKVYRTNGSFTDKEIKNNQVADSENPAEGPVLGKTPASFKLARKGEYKVLISKEGYKTAEIQVRNRVSGAGGAGMAGNLLFGGIIGVGVDASTGAMRDLTPNPIAIKLEQGEGVTVINLEKNDVPEKNADVSDSSQSTEEADPKEESSEN